MCRIDYCIKAASKGSYLCPQHISRAEELHEHVAHLFWQFRNSNIACSDFAEFLLIALYRRGALAQDLVPDGAPNAATWPKGEGQ